MRLFGHQSGRCHDVVAEASGGNPQHVVPDGSPSTPVPTAVILPRTLRPRPSLAGIKAQRVQDVAEVQASRVNANFDFPWSRAIVDSRLAGSADPAHRGPESVAGRLRPSAAAVRRSQSWWHGSCLPAQGKAVFTRMRSDLRRRERTTPPTRHPPDKGIGVQVDADRFELWVLHRNHPRQSPHRPLGQFRSLCCR